MIAWHNKGGTLRILLLTLKDGRRGNHTKYIFAGNNEKYLLQMANVWETESFYSLKRLKAGLDAVLLFGFSGFLLTNKSRVSETISPLSIFIHLVA